MIAIFIAGCGDSSTEKQSTLPKYQIIETTNLLSGGVHADILVSELTYEMPTEILEKAAFAIQKNEKLKTLALFTSIDAKKAAYSDSYAEKNPHARKGHLGGISFDTGKFSKADHRSWEEIMKEMENE